MPVDTSIYNNPPPQFNPLQTMSGVAALQNTMNQNRLFQQDYNSKLGLSQIYKEAIDPATGQLDTGKLNALMSGPNGANVTLGLPQAYQNSQEAQQRNLSINQAQLQLAQQHLSTLESYVSPLASNPNVTSKDVIGSLSQAISMGHVDPSTAAQLYASMPRNAQGQVDETQVPGWLKQQQFRMLTMQQQFDAMNPAPAPISTGGQTQLIRTPQVGAPSVAGTINNTLPPTTPTVATVNGQPNTPVALGPGTSTLQLPGGGPSATPPVPAPAAPSPPGNTAPVERAALANAMPGAAPKPTAQPAGPVQTGLAPGVADAASVQAHTSATQGATLQQAADQVPQMKATLGNLEGLLNNFTPGPGSKWTNESGAFFNRAIQAIGGKGVATDAVSAQEEFNKQAVQLAQSQFAALGGTGTASHLDSAMHTSPNATLSKMGNQNIINLLKGNADAIAVKNREWQQYMQEPGHGPQDYGKFSTAFNTAYDPRVFQSAYMTPQDRGKMLSGMSKTEQAKFRESYNFAVEHHWISDPRQQTQANAAQ